MPKDVIPDLDVALLEQARLAGVRWDQRARARAHREQAVRSHDALAVETPARLAARVNRLIADVRVASTGRRPPRNPVLRKLVERPLPVAAEEVTNELVQEAVIGAKDFLSVEFLERGVIAARSVGRVVVRSPGALRARGTGFLVAPGLAITNHHVLPTEQFAAACALEMDFEQNRFGPSKQSQIYAFEPARLYLASKELDYALVAVSPTSDRGVPLDRYGWLVLDPAIGKIALLSDDFVNIVQHPLGREKEVVLRDNHVVDLRTGAERPDEDVLGPFLHYEADTDKGSSGAPVFNDEWNVIALHHAGVPRKDAEGRIVSKSGAVWRDGEDAVEAIDWIANEAVRVSSLVAAITTAASGAQSGILKPLLDGIAPTITMPVDQTIGEAIDGAAAGGSAAHAVRTISIEGPFRIVIECAGSARDAEVPPAKGGQA